jgi:molybdopterin converting factor small subunit
VGIVLVNGRQVEKSYVIGEEDEVKLIPLLGGG